MALESVLEKFLTSRGSRRRGGVTPPGGAESGAGKTTSGAEPEPRPRPLRDGMNAWNSAQDLTGGTQTAGDDRASGWDERRERVASIDDKTTPKKARDRTRDRRRKTDLHLHPGGRSSPASVVEEEEEEGEKENEQEEVQKMREVSRRVLRYQSSRDSLLRGVGGAGTSPRPRDREGPPSPRTVISPRPKAATPPAGPNRRHSLAAPPTSYPGDHATVKPVPAVSPRAPPTPLALVGRMNSLDSCLPSAAPPLRSCPDPRTATSLPDCPTQRVPSRGPLEVPPAFRLGDLFQKRPNQGSARARLDRQGGSAFVSFFKRLGEKHTRLPATEPLES